MQLSDAASSTATESDTAAILEENEKTRLKQEFREYLEGHTSEIHAIVSHHISLRRDQQCTVATPDKWESGSFNVCIPISIRNWRKQRLMLRCPYPHQFQGQGIDNLDEKLRCDAATLTWSPANCKRTPTPRLWGFGLPSGKTFTPTTNLSWHLKVFRQIKLRLALRRSLQSLVFMPRRSSSVLKSGYLLVDFIEKDQGILLSKMTPPLGHNRTNLYQSLARIMLDAASHPQEKIGSLTVLDSGELSLSNRPFTPRLALLESKGIPTGIPKNRCYPTTEAFLYDTLHCLDQELTYQPDAVRDTYDAQGRMAVQAMLRAITPSIIQDDLRHGPFIFRWTDISPSNITVDKDYNITAIIDPEWCSFLPMETQHPPFWLSGHTADDLEGEKEKDFEKMCVEFLKVFEEEDQRQSQPRPGFYTSVMRRAIQRNMPWFWADLNDPRGPYDFFVEHLQPRFAPEQTQGKGAIDFQKIIAPYWTPQAPEFVHNKLREWKDWKKLRLGLPGS